MSPCREHATNHEVDILALRRGERPRTPGSGIALIGEAKARDRRPGLAQLHRLGHIRQLLTAAGHDAGEATLALFSTSGFTDELRQAAEHQDRVLLIGLDTLYDALGG